MANDKEYWVNEYLYNGTKECFRYFGNDQYSYEDVIDASILHLYRRKQSKLIGRWHVRLK